jgi:hypothetical protein
MFVQKDPDDDNVEEDAYNEANSESDGVKGSNYEGEAVSLSMQYIAIRLSPGCADEALAIRLSPGCFDEALAKKSRYKAINHQFSSSWKLFIAGIEEATVRKEIGESHLTAEEKATLAALLFMKEYAGEVVKMWRTSDPSNRLDVVRRYLLLRSPGASFDINVV